jgi:hypothetical protein
VSDCCESGDEPNSFLKHGEYFDQLSEYQIHEKDSTPWSYEIYLEMSLFAVRSRLQEKWTEVRFDRRNQTDMF